METLLYIAILLGISTVLFILNKKKKEVKEKYPLEPNKNVSDLELQFVEILNKKRTLENYSYDPIYYIDKRASELAREHSLYMKEVNEVSHENRGYRFTELIGMGANAYGEIMGRDVEVKRLFDRFMASPGHRSEMMNPIYNVCGISIIQGYRSELYCTVIFLKV